MSSSGSTLRWKSTRVKSIRDQVENIYCPPKTRKEVSSKRAESRPTGLCLDKSTRVDLYLAIPQNTQSRKSRRLNLVISSNSLSLQMPSQMIKRLIQSNSSLCTTIRLYLLINLKNHSKLTLRQNKKAPRACLYSIQSGKLTDFLMTLSLQSLLKRNSH